MVQNCSVNGIVTQAVVPGVMAIIFKSAKDTRFRDPRVRLQFGLQIRAQHSLF